MFEKRLKVDFYLFHQVLEILQVGKDQLYLFTKPVDLFVRIQGFVPDRAIVFGRSIRTTRSIRISAIFLFLRLGNRGNCYH